MQHPALAGHIPEHMPAGAAQPRGIGGASQHQIQIGIQPRQGRRAALGIQPQFQRRGASQGIAGGVNSGAVGVAGAAAIGKRYRRFQAPMHLIC